MGLLRRIKSFVILEKAGISWILQSLRSFRRPSVILRGAKNPATLAIVLSALFIAFLGIIIFRNQISTFFSSDPGAEPVSYWKFDEGQGSTANDSTGSNTGTLATGNSAPTWVVENQCISGKCLFFDGTNDLVGIGNVSSLKVATKTISFWARPTASFSNVTPVISNGGANWYVGFHSSDRMFFSYGNNDPIQVTGASANNSISQNEWHLYTFTFTINDPNVDILMYIDSKLISTVNNTTGYNSSYGTNFVIGAFNTSSLFFRGFIDEVKIYDYARSEAQIKADYASRGSAKGVSAQFGDDDLSRKLSNGLVGYWKMDEVGVSGSNWTAVDSSGNSNNGTGAGNASVGSTFPGKFGNTAYFDGNDDYITLNVSKMPSGVNPTYTWSTWVYYRTSAAHQKIFTWGAPTTNQGVYISIYSDGTVGIDHYGNDWYTGQAVPLGQWTHLAGTFDGNTTETLYMNGVQVKQKETVLSFTPGVSGAYIGQFFDGTEDMNSPLDEMRIYNRVLDPSEIQDLYNFAPGPVGYYDMNEKTGTTVNDKSGNGYTGSFGTGNSAPNWSSGRYSSSLYFDGSSDQVNVTGLYNSPQSYTLSGWVNQEVGDRGGDYISLGDNVLLRTTGSSISGIYRYSSFWNFTTYNNVGLTGSGWNHISFTHDSSTNTQKIYFNGVGVTSSSFSEAVVYSQGSNTSIGKHGNAGSAFYDFEGFIDDVRVYNYARTQSQIIQDMNAGHPAPGSPVGSALLHYRMDEGYGTNVNNAGNAGSTLNGIFGTGNSAPVWTNDGKFGKALSFDGTGDHINLPYNQSLNLGNNLTISLWAKRNGGLSAYRSLLVRRDPASATNSPYTLYYGSTNKVEFWIYDGSGYQSIVGNTSITDTKWHNIVVSWDGSVGSIYIDGKLDISSSFAYTPTVLGTEVLKIGSDPRTAGRDFRGDIDEVKLYALPFTATQVKVEYNQGKALVLGAGSTGLGGTSPSFSASREYCVPGDSSTCNAPVGEWKFDEGSGTSAVADTSGNINSGTMNGSMTNEDWVHGVKGLALDFDNVDDYIEVPNNSALNLGGTAVTISAWINPRSISANDLIASKGVFSGSTNKSYMILRLGGNIFSEITTGPGTTHTLTGTTTLSVNAWQYVSVVYNGTNSLLYLNGNLENSVGTTGNLVSTTSPFYIGRRPTASEYFDGKIDDVRVYDYARTQAQIAWEYNQGKPVAWYRLDECTGSTAYNAVKNGNGQAAGINGTITIGASGSQTSTGSCSSGTSTQAWNNGTTGKFNSSLNFDGVDDYISIPDDDKIDFNYNQDFSISVWFTTPSAGMSGSFDAPLEKWAGGAGGYPYSIRWDGNEQIRASRYDLTHNPTVISKRSYADDSWHHVVFTKNGSTLSLYIDGKLDGTSTDTTNTTTTNSGVLEIARQNTNYYAGQIDEIKIYNYPLTATQVKTDMAQGAVRFQ